MLQVASGAGVRGCGGEGVDRGRRGEDGLHREGESLGERYVESFNGKLRDELQNGEVFNTLRDSQVLIEGWRRHYKQVRPHPALVYRPPAPETVLMARPKISSGAGLAVMTH